MGPTIMITCNLSGNWRSRLRKNSASMWKTFSGSPGHILSTWCNEVARFVHLVWNKKNFFRQNLPPSLWKRHCRCSRLGRWLHCLPGARREEIMARGPIMDTNYKFESVFSYRPCLIGDVRPRMEEVESVDHVCIVKKRSLIKLPNLTIWSCDFICAHSLQTCWWKYSAITSLE